MQPSSAAHPLGKPVSRFDLFAAFLKIGLLGFGGVAGWVRPILVEERGWLDDREFAELFGVSSVLPGANTVNFAVMFGDRHQGVLGAAIAVFGLLVGPLAVLIAVASLYDRFAALPEVRSALIGAAAATAGLVIGNAYKMTRAIRGDAFAVLVAGLTFASSAIFHFSLVATLAIIVPASLVVFTLLARR
jgi:chromate transporter